ncbi:lasso peptide biosynthesis B2 protein [Novosphingobium sp. G106]|uniref:lasso peptide biosynthesis B2 protein n=1 Tax=Novosphingobium sp. G106 TaxID=2849500 RepID=UPI001C2DAAA9|nr:lasso peptide biosynthesis B2 protein [Novosphingobium sp. G106]MBV1686399.1 lasso peptide biosynthesis B2 protein [Novosphingobium sp. G106]
MPDLDPHHRSPHFTASPALSFCVLEGTVIVLDIVADRYFALGAERGGKILASLAGKDDLDRLPVSGVALTGDRFAGAIYVIRKKLAPPARNFSAQARPRQIPLIVETWRALWLQIAAIGRLKALGFERTLHWATHHGAGKKSAQNGRERDGETVIRAHRWARSNLPFKGVCLPASLALSRALGQAGTNYALVVGVKLNPFAAHCWVQAGDMVLNDDLETIRAFTPIRVVRG